jgi:hypothetical protein
MALGVCCSWRSSGGHVDVVNAATRSTRAKATTSTATVRKAATSMTSRHSCRLGLWGCRGLGGYC